MNLGEYEPVAWVPGTHRAAAHGTIGPDELARLDIVHGPRRASAGTYAAWRAQLRAVSPHFEFTDPPFRRSLPMTLAFAASASRPTAVLTGPGHRVGDATPSGSSGLTRTYDMVPVRVEEHPLIAAAGLLWNGDLPRELRQVLVEVAMASLFDDYRPPRHRLALA